MKPNMLEDLIYETESRSANLTRDDDLDVYAQLQQKEKDLVLAAELGKALLARKDELERQIKDLTEETSRRIEVRNLKTRQAAFRNKERNPRRAAMETVIKFTR